MPQIDRALILKAATTIGVLGSGAHSAPRIIAALCNPKVSADQVAVLIAQEPALYVRVLRVANSAYYGQSRSITNVERALVLLGLDAVRGIAAAACLDRTLSLTGKCVLLNMQALIHHSHATAAAAESLARIVYPSLAPEAFIAGLLHNLGIAAQIQLDTPGIQAMIELRASGDNRDVRELELEKSAVNHAECSAVIFEAWQLPENLIAGTRHHHNPMLAPEAHRPLAALVNLGANLGLAAGITYVLEPKPTDRNETAMAYLGLNSEQMDSVAEKLPERVAELSAALSPG